MKKLFILFYIFSLMLLLHAQEIEAKFVSKLTATANNKKIILNWKNPPNSNGIVVIYRSNEVINNETALNKATVIAEIKNEEQFIDTPEPGVYYYAAMLKNNKTNKINVIFVTFRNYTLSNVIVNKDSVLAITKIKSESNKTSISVIWDYSAEENNNQDKKVSIYRNITPIVDESHFSDAIKIASVDISSKMYTDMPISNINYYYGVFIEDISVKSFIPDVNITISPVFVDKKDNMISDFDIDNFIPLPLITLATNPETGKEMKDPFILKSPIKINYSAEISRIIDDYRMKYSDITNKAMKDKQKSLEKLPFHVLDNEKYFDAEEFKLEYNLAISQITEKDYINAKTTLEDLLSETLPDKLKKRACFYVGMIYYYLSDYNKAYIFMVVPFLEYRKEILPYLDSIHYQLYESIER